MADTYFKKYARDYRVQTTEETFKDGQVFTRAPLDTGKSRLLVNYDITDEGEAITNRKGIRTELAGLPLNTGGLNSALTENISISQSKDAVTEDDIHYRLVVANQFKDTDEEVPNANLYKAPAELWVIKSDSTNSYDCLKEYDIDIKDMYAIPLSYELDDESEELPKSYYKIPDKPKANGMPLTDIHNLAQPVGTFWGNDYYSFNSNGDLMRSRYMPAGDGIDETFLVEKLDPREVSVSEATTQGFNMLSPTPYVYNDSFNAGTIQLDGIFFYDKEDFIVARPLLNTKYKVRCFYTVESGVKYKIVWDYKEVGTETWVNISSEEIQYTSSESVTEPGELSTEFSSGLEDVIIRISAYKFENGEYGDTPEKTLGFGVPFEKVDNSSTANRELVNYDLSKATGMVYWRNCLWLYGLAQDPTVLFCSAVNDPIYFPYPHNIDIFDEPIISLTPFNDTLLVFTKSQLIQLTLSEDGGWTKNVLQSNLDFTEFDARFIQVVKNMVFFKSGDYYYMIVPKTLSLKNELAIAPVSKNIEYFLDDFEENIKNLLDILYDYEDEFSLVNHYNFLNYEDVHNVYTFKLNGDLFLNIVLLYNTVSRTWRLYSYESQEFYYPLKQDATKPSTLMAPLYMKIDDGSNVTDIVGVQFLETSRTEVKDFYIPKESVLNKEDSTWKEDEGVIADTFEENHKYKNWTILDTGYRNTNIDYNKRYRELQFKFNNVSAVAMNFITEFILDGETRINKYKYDVEHIVDPSDPNYGMLYVTRTPIENLELPGATTLGIDDDDVNAWSLDSSRFPEIAFWKVRLKVSGKGYTPRFRLISRTEERYELLGYTWVYRQLYSR